MFKLFDLLSKPSISNVCNSPLTRNPLVVRRHRGLSADSHLHNVQRVEVVSYAEITGNRRLAVQVQQVGRERGPYRDVMPLSVIDVWSWQRERIIHCVTGLEQEVDFFLGKLVAWEKEGLIKNLL